MASPATENAGFDLAKGITLADFGGKPMLRDHVAGESRCFSRGSAMTFWQSAPNARITAAR